MKINYRIYIHFVLPAVLAIMLFVLSIFIVIIPRFERNMLDSKKEMISELTHAAWSVLDEYQQKVYTKKVMLEEAQREAASIIELMRYGNERKDYFWIIDLHPKMIMHPYRPELNGKDLSNYQDPEGKFLFAEAATLVKDKGEGFIQYIWQWKDDSTRLVPKLSYVKAYPNWGWIIGTGIYLEDVQAEIKALRTRLLRVSLLIVVVIAIMLFYIVRKSLDVEQDRKQAEDDLRFSRQKYKSLVEASTEGTIMIMHDKIIFANMKFIQMLGCSSDTVESMHFEEIFDYKWSNVMGQFTNPNKSVVVETTMHCNESVNKEVILYISRINYANDKGYVVIARNVTRQKRLEIGAEELSKELQMSLLLMNQPIRCYIRDLLVCEPDTTVSEAAHIMTHNKQAAIFIQHSGRIIGIVDENDLKTRFIAEKKSMNVVVSEIMSAPVLSIDEDALLYEAQMLFKDRGISHILVKNKNEENIGVLNNVEILSLQQNTLNFILREIHLANEISTLERIHSRTPVIVQALLESGDNTVNINHVITSISDALTQQLMKLCLEGVSPPPCEFAFIALGSEGRSEQTLSTDQDNAIVFSDVPDEELNQTLDYFNELAKKMNTGLNQIGFRFCVGEVMAMNPKWTQPLSVWKKYFADWINNSDPQSILDSSIFFDLRCIYGKQEFADELHQYIQNTVDSKAVFLQHMAAPVIKYKTPVGVFGGIVGDQVSGESKMIDIKKIQVPIVGFARIYALKYKLNDANTLARIQTLKSRGYINKDLARELTFSYGLLMQLRLRFQARAEMENRSPDNMIDLSYLTSIELTTLKKVLTELGNMQAQLNFDFKGGV